MRIVGVLGLIFTLAFALVATTQVLDLQMDTAALAGGPAAALAAIMPHFWYILVGMVAAVLLLGAFTVALHR